MPAPRQEYRQERPDTALDISQQDVHPVQRRTISRRSGVVVGQRLPPEQHGDL
jgi:hypothetical protein